jgi:hypothetical protein
VPEVVQTADAVEPAALMQVDPGEGAAGAFRSVRIKDRRLAERVIDVPLYHVARVVKDRGDIIVGILGDLQAFVERAFTVGVDRLSAFRLQGPRAWCD